MTPGKFLNLAIAFQIAAICSGCRSAPWRPDAAAEHDRVSSTQLLAVDRHSESSDIGLVNDTSTVQPEERGRFWELLKPREVFNLPRTDFWSKDEMADEQSTGFETGF